jgi:hypothetical protein
MTPEQSKALELIKKFEDLKEQMKAVKEEMDKVLTSIGVGKYFQDPETKIVYSISEADGKFVYFDKITYKRTKKESERQGSLSKAEATSQGFVL